jgi:hypothetical protein
MRRKVVATVELEFDVEDPTHLLPHPEWTEARQANLRQLIEDAVRSGLTKADGGDRLERQPLDPSPPAPSSAAKSDANQARTPSRPPRRDNCCARARGAGLGGPGAGRTRIGSWNVQIR